MLFDAGILVAADWPLAAAAFGGGAELDSTLMVIQNANVYYCQGVVIVSILKRQREGGQRETRENTRRATTFEKCTNILQ